MKKLLIMPVLAAALFTGVNADNTLSQTITILPSAVVSFGTPVAANSLSGTDKFLDYSINFGSNEIGTTPTHQVDVYVQTNVEDTKKVQMTITADDAGALTTADTNAADIVMAYAYGVKDAEVAIALGTPVDLTTGENAGGSTDAGGAVSGSTGSFTATPTIAGNQLAGTYTANLTVTIAAL